MSVLTRELIVAEVRAEIARQGMSARQVARQIGLSQAQINERMTCKTDFRVTELLAIAAVLEVPVTQFLPEPTPTARAS